MTKITTLEDLNALLAVAGRIAEPVVVREGFRIWTLTEDENGEWWAWSWREEGEDGKPRRVGALWLPLTVLYAPGIASEHDRKVAAQALRDAAGALPELRDMPPRIGPADRVRAWLRARADALTPRQDAPGVTKVAVAGRCGGKTDALAKATADECERRGLSVEIVTAPGVSVSAEQVEAAARATLTPGVNPWSPRFRSGLHDFLAALGVTVTDGGA